MSLLGSSRMAAADDRHHELERMAPHYSLNRSPGVLTEFTRVGDASDAVRDALHSAENAARVGRAPAGSGTAAELVVCVRAPTRVHALEVVVRELRTLWYHCVIRDVRAEVHNDGGWGIVLKVVFTLLSFETAFNQTTALLNTDFIESNNLVAETKALFIEALGDRFENDSFSKGSLLPETSALSTLSIINIGLRRATLKEFCVTAAKSTHKRVGKVHCILSRQRQVLGGGDARIRDNQAPVAEGEPEADVYVQQMLRLSWRTEAYSHSEAEGRRQFLVKRCDGGEI